jgi:hypothetical protein
LEIRLKTTYTYFEFLSYSIQAISVLLEDYTTLHVIFREVNLIIFDRFCAADYDSVLGFFPARQDFEIIGLSSVINGLY